MTEYVVAESGIRRLHACCVDAVWRKDPVAFADCFAKDGEWHIAGMQLRSRAVIEKAFGDIMEQFERTFMMFGTPILTVGNGTASGRTYVTERTRFKTGRTAITMGAYYERFVDEGDRWRFHWRHWTLFYLGPPDMTGKLFEFKDQGLPPGLPAHDEPATPPASEIF